MDFKEFEKLLVDFPLVDFPDLYEILIEDLNVDLYSDEIEEKIYDDITVRNLICHIYPFGSWKDSVEELSEHISIFNGKKIIAVAISNNDFDTKEISEFINLKLSPDKIFYVINDPILREQVSFSKLLKSVLNSNSNEATFYCHSKANTTPDKDSASKWRQVMNNNLLGRWNDAMNHLKKHAFVGTHKMIWPKNVNSPFPTMIKPIHCWMHCGTFYWFRNDRIYQIHRDELIIRDRYGVEAWPGSLVNHREAYSMWQPWEESDKAYPQKNPYDLDMYDKDYSK